ncbi:MAG: DUF2848 domain-containing protein [Alphaproteobacteria bacterium]|nr:MAG: DUF2848 domain-containing protein [Alphaproteobacteria bacterium]
MPPRPQLRLTLLSKDGQRTVDAPINRLIVAGWSSRNAAAMEAHIAELEKVGVARPAKMPTFYRISATRLTTSSWIQVSGTESSGEVEFLLAKIEDEIWVGVASDHTDRAVESYNVTVSKQLCEKPMAPTLWPFHEVRSHWDSLRLQSFRIENSERHPYQDGSVADLLSAEELMARFTAEDGGEMKSGDAIMGGTLPTLDSVKPATRFAFALIDPVLNRRIEHAYDIESLNVEP